jgi:hypothetical protein
MMSADLDGARTKKRHPDDVDAMVRQLGEAHLDAFPSDHRSDLDEPLLRHRRQLRIRVLVGVHRYSYGKIATGDLA